ncbi:uncharacterized protein F5891DRAFT_1004632 [Suillus fuscotomentosus]|uniref:MYND-type domain-containing protein n=1 Tax=Suillus fuscotomentosus TaxID=1912939 RepID=A0AAD4EHA7_9AGAM|nr:uncharacterized protein F5891DRAFT_1004632 [Suillus fuscotomentosus]KAG1906219.1 hypothetical protein F5891DRAFT_1004632 [Suillus fuscotomentosus]
MPLTAQERTALKYLPKRIQRSTDGALEGVVHDVRKLYHWVDNSTDVDANMTLLPIFYAHLDPAVIPDQPLPTDDVQKVVILAKLSLMSIVQTCASVRGVLSESLADKMITDALVRRWDTLFPWLQFMYRHFLPFPPRRVPEGFDICDVEVVSITTRALSQMAISVAGQHLIQSNMSIQQFIAKLWLYIGKLKDEDLLRHDASFRHDGREGVNDEMTGHVRRIMVGIITACMPVALPAPFAVPTLHNLLDAMGGYEPFVASALRYIRWFGRKIGDMNNRTTSNYGFVTAMLGFVDALSILIRFLSLVSIMDATCQEELILHRAPSDVVTALLQTWPVLTGVRVNSSTETSTEKRCTMILEDTFDYIDVILRQSEACIPALCQVLDAGFIQLVLQAGFRCPQMASSVLKLIPRFLMYHKVLHHFQKVMDQTANNMARFGPHAKKDDEVQQTWILVQQAARQILNVCRKTSPLPFYEQKCANLQCPYDNNRPPHYRCCGCFVARYCSRGCQRTDWKSRHRTACPVLHSAGGFDGSKRIRGSLPLIMLVETFNYSLYADRIQEAMERARKDYPEDIERLVLETDLSAYPVTFSARPVEQYADMFDPRFDPAMLKELRGLPGKHLLMALKLRAGREECIVLSPRVGLTLAFQWPAAREEEAVLSAVQEALVSRLAVGPGNVIKRGDGFKVVEYKQPPLTQPI